MLGLIFAIFSLGLLVACAPDGSSTAKDISGTTMVFGPWEAIDETESHLYFVGENKPVIRSIQSRLRDNRLTQERIRLETGVYQYSSVIYLERTPGGYGITTTQYIHSKAVLSDKARESFSGATITEVRDGENSQGKFLYAVAERGDGIRCVFARQGLGSVMGRSDEHYTAVATFRYCARKTEREILEIFGNMRLRG